MDHTIGMQRVSYIMSVPTFFTIISVTEAKCKSHSKDEITRNLVLH